MNKAMLALLTAALLGSSYVTQAQVSSVNAVGYYQLTVPTNSQYSMVSVQLDPMDPTNATLLGVMGTNNLQKANNPNGADKVYIWTGLRWAGYFQKLDGLFYVYPNVTGSIPTNPPLLGGTAIFLQGVASLITNRTITISGEVVSDVTASVSIPGVYASYAFLTYPFSCGTTLQGMSLKYQGTKSLNPTANDKLTLFDTATQKYYAYYLRGNDAGTHRLAWQTNPTNAVDPDWSIPMGQAFWYQARNTFTWVETNQYLNSL
jgi:hypothetical protein